MGIDYFVWSHVWLYIDIKYFRIMIAQGHHMIKVNKSLKIIVNFTIQDIMLYNKVYYIT